MQVVSAFSDENLCLLDLPSSSTVLDIKRHVQASHGISIFRQRLLVSQAGKWRTTRSWPPFQAFDFNSSGWSTLMTMPTDFVVSFVQLARGRPLKWSAC